eukprot:12405249-Karenia_brevis.AAC.1
MISANQIPGACQSRYRIRPAIHIAPDEVQPGIPLLKRFTRHHSMLGSSATQVRKARCKEHLVLLQKIHHRPSPLQMIYVFCRLRADWPSIRLHRMRSNIRIAIRIKVYVKVPSNYDWAPSKL